MIAIVGGGITGLAAGYELTLRGVPFVIFDAAEQPGGLIQTEHVDGFTIEAGPDSVLAQKPAAIELCEALGLGPQLITTNLPRTPFVLSRGRLHALPSPSVLGIPITWTGIAQYDLLSPRARLRLAMERFVPRRNSESDESVASFFQRRFGDETVNAVAQPLLGGIHAGDIGELSVRSLFPRFVDAEASHGSVLRAFRHAQRPTRDGLFRSLSGGMSQLVAALVRRLPSGALRTRAAVDRLERDEDGWRVNAGGGVERVRAVLLTCPASVTARLLRPIDQRAADLCAEVPYVSTVSIAMAWPRGAVGHPLRGSGFVVARHSNSGRLTACTWVSSKWHGRAPAGMVLLRAFAGGSHDPGIVDMPDEDLTSMATQELSTVLGISGAPVLARIYRWRQAGAQHQVGHLARVAEIERQLARHSTLFVAGSGFRSIGIPDCIADGRAAAAKAVMTRESVRS